MSKKFIVADWHIGEDRFELMGRPFTTVDEHIDHLVTEHNKLVTPEDFVYVVGDVCYQKSPEFLPHVSRFNGTKILFRGNHDRVFTDEQLEPYFKQIVPEGQGLAITVDAGEPSQNIPCYITHYPSEGVKDRFNLVGHIHAAWKYQLNMFNVGIDANHFRPTDMDKIPFHFNAVAKFYDADVWVCYNEINTAHREYRGKKDTYFRPAPKI